MKSFRAHYMPEILIRIDHENVGMHGIPMATAILADLSWESKTERFSLNRKEMEDYKGVFYFF